MDKKAIVHVENSTNLIEFAKFLDDFGWTIFSANETEEQLKKAGIRVTREPVLQQNNFFINDTAALISRIINTKDWHNEQIDKSILQSESYFILCLNLVPEIVSPNSKSPTEINIPKSFQISTIIRNAFVNYENVLILTDPDDYKEAMIQLRTDNIDPSFRTYLAAKALNMVSSYDSGISFTLQPYSTKEPNFMKYFAFPVVKATDFSFGTNEQQKACMYLLPTKSQNIQYLSEVQNNKISYNIANDISFAWEHVCLLSKHLKSQFSVECTNSEGYAFTNRFTPLTEVVFSVIVKYNCIVGAALSSNMKDSFLTACNYDSSLDDLVLACSCVVDEEGAKEIINQNFSAIIAPDFTEEAKKVFQTKQNILLFPAINSDTIPISLRLIDNGILVQTKDDVLFSKWDVKTSNRPSLYISDEMAFGTVLATTAKSHCAILLKNNSIMGIGQACLSSKKAVDQSLIEAKSTVQRKQISGTLADLLVSDSPIELSDSIKELIENGLSAIIQPGGTKNDEEFIKYCNEHGIVMVFTNMSHINF